MKVITITLGPTSIEFHNSILGKETIKVNGEIVSSKYSAAGTEHVFTVLEAGEDVEYKLMTGLGLMGLAINLIRNDLTIIESQKSKGWIKVAIIIFISIFLGAIIVDIIS